MGDLAKHHLLRLLMIYYIILMWRDWGDMLRLFRLMLVSLIIGSPIEEIMDINWQLWLFMTSFREQLRWLMLLRSEMLPLPFNLNLNRSHSHNQLDLLLSADTPLSTTTKETRKPPWPWLSSDSCSARCSRARESSESPSKSSTASTTRSSSPSGTPNPSSWGTGSSFIAHWTESSKSPRPISSISQTSEPSGWGIMRDQATPPTWRWLTNFCITQSGKASISTWTSLKSMSMNHIISLHIKIPTEGKLKLPWFMILYKQQFKF